MGEVEGDGGGKQDEHEDEVVGEVVDEVQPSGGAAWPTLPAPGAAEGEHPGRATSGAPWPLDNHWPLPWPFLARPPLPILFWHSFTSVARWIWLHMQH